MAHEGLGSGYILVGARGLRERNVFYTGGAGDNWVSESWNDAFRYASKMEAERKAAMFNQFSGTHGISFDVKWDFNRYAILREIFHADPDQKRRERAFALSLKMSERNIEKARRERRIYPAGA